MLEGCIGNCLLCGKCKNFAILDQFAAAAAETEPRDGVGAAVDIGTTSVVLALSDLSTGQLLARHSFMNPQRVYGPDVISRISAANDGALAKLQALIVTAVGDGLNEAMRKAGVQKLSHIVIAGNTVMTYLLLGLSPESLGAVPFKPAYPLENNYDLFGSTVTPVPFLSAFVGGDITAGLLYVLPRGAEHFLLIDLGTNGEMAVYSGGKLTVTSTAAGPAFEGSGRTGGASKVLDDLAELIRDGWIDETGLLDSGAPERFTQKQIRDLQLAKSAVRSGVEILLEATGLDYAALDAVYLAGGIGQALNVDSAALVGLLPAELKAKVSAIGNASLGGAARLLLSPEQTAADMKTLLENKREINLAEHPKFNDLFMENMFFEVP